MRLIRRLSLPQLVLFAATVLFVGGAGVVAACKTPEIDCNLLVPEFFKKTPLTITDVVQGEIALPAGFTTETVASGLDQPVTFDFLPDGRILIGERSGLVRLAEQGRLAEQPILDLRARVATEYWRGLVALAVDPDFEVNAFVYVVYAVRPTGDPKSATVVRVSRFALTETSAGEEVVILGAGGDKTDSCTALPSSADCLPSDVDHIGADIAFGDDGTLFISTGDGGGLEAVEETAFRAQDIDALGGKILHVTRDGLGLETNPFFAGDPSANRSKVWAVGLRNPFRLTLTSAGLPIVADVGWRVTDEIDAAPAGVNLGWPCYEGEARTMEYEATTQCQALYQEAAVPRGPLIVLPHPDASSVIGGVIYDGDAYPDEYRGSYFYGDWGFSWIRHVRVDPQSGELDGKPQPFAEAAGGPTAFHIGPDGLLYVLSLNHGKVHRIDYSR
ncbi:MAG: PQQ-dependent sugar dehydrogenase [Actinomycetota bacterium]